MKFRNSISSKFWFPHMSKSKIIKIVAKLFKKKNHVVICCIIKNEIIFSFWLQDFLFFQFCFLYREVLKFWSYQTFGWDYIRKASLKYILFKIQNIFDIRDIAILLEYISVPKSCLFCIHFYIFVEEVFSSLCTHSSFYLINYVGWELRKPLPRNATKNFNCKLPPSFKEGCRNFKCYFTSAFFSSLTLHVILRIVVFYSVTKTTSVTDCERTVALDSFGDDLRFFIPVKLDLFPKVHISC